MPSMVQRVSKVNRIFFIGMCVDYELSVWVLWRKDRDYFDRMQIFGGIFFEAAVLGCNMYKRTRDRMTRMGQKNEPDCAGS